MGHLRLAASAALLLTIGGATYAQAEPTAKSRTSLVNASVLGGAYVNDLTAAVPDASGGLSIVETRTKNAAKYAVDFSATNLLPSTCYQVWTGGSGGFATFAAPTSTDETGTLSFSEKLVDVDQLVGKDLYLNQCSGGSVLVSTVPVPAIG